MLDVKKLGQKIRFFRNRLGMTQAELADRIHVSFQAISSWECGNTLPDIENLCRISDVFGVSLDTLLQRGYSEESNILIGIDGGGTSTEFSLFTSEGNIIKNFKLPGTNVSNIGLSEGLSIYHHGLDMCLQDVPAVAGIFIGCAGGYRDEVQQRLSECYPDIPIKIDSDGVNALASADVDAALVCGTGTVAFRKESENSFKKIAGWGSRFGDPGSGYSFGCAAVNAALSYEDGVITSPNIYCILKQRTGEAGIRGTFSSKSTVSQIADLVSVIFEAYAQGDEIAKEIIYSEMKKLAPIVNAACPKGGSIAMCGGVNMHYGNITLPILKEFISSDIEFVIPKLPPIYGACREALRRFDVEKGENFFENFFKDYTKLE